MGDRAQQIAPARLKGLHSHPLPGNGWCQEGISVLIPAVAWDGVICPQEHSALVAVATGQQEGYCLPSTV